MNKAEIKNKELLNILGGVQNDGMTVFVMAEGQFRGAFYNGTRMINQMRANQDLGILETYILGQALLCAALLIPTMKGKEHLTLTYETDGICKGFVAEADSTGYVRGHLLQDSIPLDKPLESWDLSPFFGNCGTLTVQRIGEGMKTPMTSSVELQYKNIALDLAYYFSQSEQIHTAFKTSIHFDKMGRVVGAGGMFLQVVPGAGGKSKISAQNENSGNENAAQIREELIERAERAVNAMPSIGTWFYEGGNREDVVYGLFREFNPAAVLDRDVIFDCPCSEKSFIQRIKSLPKTELEDIIATETFPLEVICQNCKSKYYISKEVLL
ncbi:MAG: Hsp33 family molecular chaperone HslO [Treponema sp.]|nr:Hsp33 family molecular chaperone HslO [Treponema sp.]